MKIRSKEFRWVEAGQIQSDDSATSDSGCSGTAQGLLRDYSGTAPCDEGDQLREIDNYLL